MRNVRRTRKKKEEKKKRERKKKMLKRRKGVTPGQRHRVRMKVDTEGGRKKVPLSLRVGKKGKGGRNGTGRITVHHRGGGVKRLRRKRVNGGKEGGVGKVVGIQYDPNRTGRVGRRRTEKGEYKYVLAVEGRKVGERVQYGDNWEGKEKEEKEREEKRRKGERKVKREGSTKKRKKREVGGRVCNREVEEGKGGKYVRTAGGSGVVLRKEEEKGKVVVRRKTGVTREVSGECTGTQGKVSGEEHRMEKRGKAGRKRRRGKRPKVRGEAMNPVDHPHGGRTRGGRQEVTPWGKRAKGKKTRKKKKKSRYVIEE